MRFIGVGARRPAESKTHSATHRGEKSSAILRLPRFSRNAGLMEGAKLLPERRTDRQPALNRDYL